MMTHRAMCIMGMESPLSCDERYFVKGLGVQYVFELYVDHSTDKAYILCNNEGDEPIFTGHVSTVYSLWWDIVGLHPTLFLCDDWYNYVIPKKA